jgi:cell division protein FtsQ
MRLLCWLVPGVLVALCLGGAFLLFIRDHAAFQVVAVRVYGAEHVPQAELIQLAQIGHGTSLLRLNVEGVRRRIMQHPWIREALVRRVYPNELQIIVYERRPAALLDSGNGHLIDNQGYLLGQATPMEMVDLPRLTAKVSQPLTPGERLTDPAIQAGLRLLQQASDSPYFREAPIARIDAISPERFLVRTPRGKLIVGSDLVEVDHKLQMFPVLDEALHSKARRVEHVDVSIENQIIVKTTARTTQGGGRLQKRGGNSGQVQ